MLRRLIGVLIVAVVLGSACSGLSGCGQKGDLYMPDEPAPQAQDDDEDGS